MSLNSGKRTYIITTGRDACEANLSLLALGRGKVPKVSVSTATGDGIRAQRKSDGRVEYQVPANGRLMLSW